MSERGRRPSTRDRTKHSRFAPHTGARPPASASGRRSGSLGDSEPAYDAAARYLGPRPRSVLEVRRHLIKKRYDEREVSAAIARLRELGHLDDAAFARYWLGQRARFRPKGSFALKSELRAKGVDPSIVDEAMGEGSEAGEGAAAEAALATRLPRWAHLDADERHAKAQAFLRQRGFPYDVIEEVLARL